MPVWCEVVADTLTPVTAFANLVGDGEGFLFESVEGGERWGRYSFVGRRPLATLTARGKAVRADGRLGLGSSDKGILARGRDTPRPLPVARPSTGCRPCTEGWWGISGTTWCARSSACRTSPRTTWATPMPRSWSSGSSPPSTTGASASRSSTTWSCPATRTPRPRSWRPPTRGRAPAWRSWPATAPGPGRGDGAGAPQGIASAEASRTMSSEEYRAAIAIAKDYITAGDIFQVVLSQRFDLQLDADPFDVYRALRLLNPSPYLYFLRFPEVDRRRRLARADGAPARRDRDLAAHCGLAAPGRERAARPPARGRAGRGPQGTGGAHHAGRSGPQRCRAGWSASAPRRSTS